MKSSLRCFLFGHTWKAPKRIRYDELGLRITEYETVKDCWHCGLSKKEAGITSQE